MPAAPTLNAGHPTLATKLADKAVPTVLRIVDYVLSHLTLATKLADKAVLTVLGIVDYVLRQLNPLDDDEEHRAAQQRRTSDDSSKRSASRDMDSSAPAAELYSDSSGTAGNRVAIAQEVLKLGYRLFPRVVLSCCLQSFKGGDSNLYSGSVIFFRDYLLLETPGCSSGSGRPGGERGGEGAAPPPAASKARGCCLAAEVLNELPDTKHWLRQVIFSISKDKRVVGAKDIHSYLDKLLKLVTPTLVNKPAPAPPPPPPPPPQSRSESGGSGRDRSHGPGTETPPSAPHSTPPEPPAPQAAPHSETDPSSQFIGRGGPICRSDACLFIGGLPPPLAETTLREECSKHGDVESVHMFQAGSQTPFLSHGEAYVVFSSILRVSGSAPGLLLENQSSPHAIQHIVDCLIERLTPSLKPNRAPIQLPAQLHAPGQPSYQGGAVTLWVGNLNESVREEELLAYFGHFGEVTSYRFIRSNHCVFIDFQHPKAAAEARRASNGMMIGPQAIRVEWKPSQTKAAAEARRASNGMMIGPQAIRVEWKAAAEARRASNGMMIGPQAIRVEWKPLMDEKGQPATMCPTAPGLPNQI
eukprot:gene29781-5244_t